MTKTYNTVLSDAVSVERAYAKGSASVASALLALACATNKADDFKSACVSAEEWIKSDEAGANKLEDNEKMPRAWTQAKSDIAAGLDAGLNPSDYPTYSKFKAAKVEARKSSASVAALNTADKDGPVAVADSAPPPMKGPLADLLKMLAEMPDKQANNFISNWTQQARAAVNKNKKRGGGQATKKAA